MNLNDLSLLYNALGKVQTDGSEPNSICTQTSSLLDEPVVRIKVNKWMVRAFAVWPHRSHHPCFPVQHPTMDAMVAFVGRGLWEGEYGRNRRKLLDFLRLRAKSEYSSRYKNVQNGKDPLSKEEILAGWFFDDDYDDLLAHKSWAGHGD